MWYVLEDLVPANTARASARETSIKVHRGILHTIYVTIPPGSAQLAHCQLRKGGYFILPRNEDKDISGVHIDTLFKEWLHLPDETNRLTLKTWNEDTVFPHTVTLYIGVLEKEVLEVEEQYLHTLNMFMKLFRRRT